MAEQDANFISPDKHRADLTEVRLEFKEELHGVRQDVAVLSKSVEQVAQMVGELRTQMDRQFAQIDRQFAQIDRQFTQVDRQFTELRQDLRELRTTTQRQMWVLITVVVVTIIGGMIKIAFFP